MGRGKSGQKMYGTWDKPPPCNWANLFTAIVCERWCLWAKITFYCNCEKHETAKSFLLSLALEHTTGVQKMEDIHNISQLKVLFLFKLVSGWPVGHQGALSWLGSLIHCQTISAQRMKLEKSANQQIYVEILYSTSSRIHCTGQVRYVALVTSRIRCTGEVEYVAPDK